MNIRRTVAAVLLSVTMLGQGIVVHGEDFSESANNVLADQQAENNKLSLDEIKKLSGWKDLSDEKTAQKDGEICDYPSLRDGEPVKEIKKGESFRRIGTIYDGWSCVIYQDDKKEEQTGFILTETLEEQQVETEESLQEDLSQEGMIGQSTDIGVFAEASQVEAAAADIVMAAEDTNLKPLGQYRITHYCPCSICCGPWTNGITSTGVTAMTNRTIAVDPRVIPYGCNIVINGQVYVAEDCGGAIKGNRIDIYVASHQEAMDKGVYYADVYLVQ